MRFQLRPLLLALLLTTPTQAQPATGYIQIVAGVGVRVFVDGRLSGRTTHGKQGLVITDVPMRAQAHRLRFERDGFKPLRAEAS